jgi:plastocyanin
MLVKPIKHVTMIRVSEDGMFEYEKGLIRIYPGDTVTWVCDTGKKGPFTIHIGWDSPFEACSFHSTDGKEITATLPLNARPGYYRYMIAVLIDGKIYTDDPELIVKKPKRGG